MPKLCESFAKTFRVVWHILFLFTCLHVVIQYSYKRIFHVYHDRSLCLSESWMQIEFRQIFDYAAIYNI